MMKIEIAPQDPEFANLVEIPGDKFLADNPNITTEQIENKPLWRKAIPGLRKAYKGICAYCAIWIPPGVGNSSVDHYRPKSRFPELTYKWDNLRLVAQYINGAKGIKDVLDPKDVEDDWFIMNLLTFEVEVTSSVPENVREKAENTIKWVRLNDKRMTELREVWFKSYAKGETNIDGLRKRAPFIARQLDIANQADLKIILEALKNAPD